jgi:RNA polymerase sigma-70 factor (ECF subfamily)
LPDVDDVVQETYTRLLKARATGPIACVRGFLFVTARNFALNHLRHQRLERSEGDGQIDPTVLPDGAQLTPETLAHEEELQVLMSAIASLPERCRQVVTLRKIYGLSQREVASQLGISEHTVEVQAGIGLRKCIDFFRRHGYGRQTRA